ncbi:hypothetical protein H6P81_021663 [Aristolochia fimbriata]|uniref:Homing endonuclease LAGLIDADG domain-containing protein n=1 Tax=Aristolochia fimbriata TaxID=158543 RepID=A0AAV7DPC0_ARIFI|nr:hypothetical protein H6P81_021663 [Aristolochia fimbriata]
MGTFFPYHYITYGNRHALVRICENGSIMKSLAMVDFFIENKGTFFPHPYITYGNRHSLVRISKNGSIMKSMAMELSSHIITLPMETDTLWNFLPISLHYLWKQTRFGPIFENGSIMKSMAMVDFFIENKGTFFPYHYITNGNRHALVRISKNGSLMKSMTMVDFFIENKGTFFPYHYITYGNRHALVQICENRSIMKSMAMVDFLH